MRLTAEHKDSRFELKRYRSHDDPCHCLYPMVLDELKKVLVNVDEPNISYVKDAPDMPARLIDSYL